MLSRPINKPISNSEWESHKDMIKSLYLTDNMKLKGPGGLMAYMANVYEFTASEAQYEARLRKWCFSKNRSQNDWKSLGKKIAKRKGVGKASDIYLNNKLVPSEKVHRQITRYASPPTLGENFQESNPRTPKGFTIQTPEAEDVTMLSPIWTNDLPFFQLESHLASSVNRPIISVSNTDFQEFIDPRILHVFDDIAPGSSFENRAIGGDLLLDLQPYIFNQIGRIQQEIVPDSQQLIAMLKSLLPKSVLDCHLAAYMTLNPVDESWKSIFFKALIFSVANSFIHYRYLPINMTECLRFSMDTEMLQSLQRLRGPESEALAENLFLAAIEAKNGDLTKFLLLNTGLDCNKLICIVEGEYYTPVERSSQLGSIEVTKHLIDAQADVNKTFEVKKCGGALARVIDEQEYQDRGDLKLVHMLLQAGAEVKLATLNLAIWRANLNLVELLIHYRVKTSHTDWIESGVLQKAILFFDNQSAMDIVTSIIQAGACSTSSVSPAVKMSLMCALEATVGRGSLELVRLLLSSGAPLTTKTLSLAVESGKHEMVQFILSFGVKPMEMDLNAAVKFGHNELVQFILGHGVCPTNGTLSLAVKSGSKELVQSLLDAGADADSLSLSGITPLAEAIRSKNGQIVELLGLKGAWSRITEKARFESALKAASEVGEIEIVRRLLRSGVNIEACDLRWPLLAAIRAKHNAIVEILLDAGAEVGLSSSSYRQGRVPLLIEAVKTRDPNLVRSILDADADVNETEGSSMFGHPQTALLEAVKWGDQTIIGDLIASGSNINESMALAFSVQKKDAKTVQILLDAGADVNHFSKETGETALYAAVKNGDIGMTEVLISNGADPNDYNALLAAILYSKPMFQKLLEEFKRRYRCTKKGCGSSALLMAILKGDLKLIENLLAYGLDPNAFLEDMSILADNIYLEDTVLFESRPLPRPDLFIKDIFPLGWDPEEVYMTPLGLAIAKDPGKNILVVQKLLKAGGDPNSIVRYQHYGILRRTTALLAAIETKSLPLVQLLIDAGAEVNRPSTYGVKRTPLQRAAETGSFDIVQILLNEKASVNAKPAMRGGGTALQLAAIGGWVGIAELLLDWGADPNAPASKMHGRNAVEGAAEYGRIDMLKLISNAGAKVSQQVFQRSCNLAEKNGHFATKKYLESLYLDSLSGIGLLDI